jgi:hypothetical protein
VGANGGGVVGPAGQPLTEWLQKLQGDNRQLAGANGFDNVRDDAKHRAAAGEVVEPGTEIDSLFPVCGTPISWQSQSRMEPPILQLTSRAHQQTRQALAASGQWLGLLVVLWVLSFLPFLQARLRLFWPEQLALLGIAGWHLAGPTGIVLLLLVVALFGRVFLLARGLRSLVRKREHRPSTLAASPAGGERGT